MNGEIAKQPRMSSRWAKRSCLVAAVILGTALASYIFKSPDLSYQGKSIGTWFEESLGADTKESTEAKRASCERGGKALPF